MENELQILNNIEKNNNATQRDIAKNTGLSLGNVNILIKRLVKKGLLKIERLNPRTIRYILTPQGMKEKAEPTYNYVVASYRFINSLNARIDKVVEAYQFGKNSSVVLFGSKEEIFELICDRLRNARINACHMQSFEQISHVTSRFSVIIVWHPDFAALLEDKEIEHINLLAKI
ncbi:MAG: winged helix-turn-helix transcriptional regulator [Clostridia bacterium]|nr:winged helix-turn-helix transcriptional regulator [Clostridia bacterium]